MCSFVICAFFVYHFGILVLKETFLITFLLVSSPCSLDPSCCILSFSFHLFDEVVYVVADVIYAYFEGKLLSDEVAFAVFLNH